MPSRYRIGGMLSVLAAMSLSACVTVEYPEPDVVSFRVDGGEAPPAPRRVAVVVVDAEVRLLSTFGAHDRDLERSLEATRSWRLAVSEFSRQRPSYHPVDVTNWDASKAQEWLAAQAIIERWLQELLEDRYGALEKTFEGTGNRHVPPAVVSRSLRVDDVVLPAAFPELNASTAADLALDLDWKRWRGELEADDVLVLFSSDTRATPDRMALGAIAGTVAGAGIGAGVAFACVSDDPDNNLEAFFAALEWLACAVVTVPVGTINGMVVVPQRIAGEHRFSAAMVDMRTGKLQFSARSLTATDSDDGSENVRLLDRFMP